MIDRRYDDKEIAAIFRAATEGSQSSQRDVPRDEGLTLADLQAIGREVGGAGFAVLGVTATVAISSALGGSLGDAIPGIALLAVAGIAMIASGALRLPHWARLRERQMEDLATRVALPPDPSK